jgi:uncharacterized Zn-binding protein involved in type VI secretion
VGEDGNKKLWPSWEEDIEANHEEAGKASHESKRYEKGIGNRKPEGPPKAKSGFEVSVGPLFKAEGVEVDLWDSPDEKGADQTRFLQFGRAKLGELEVGAASVNLTEGKAKAVLAKGKVEASVAHAEVDMVDAIKELLSGDDTPLRPPLAAALRTMPAPGAAHLGSFVAHGGVLAPGIGSQDVFVEGAPAWRALIDSHFCTAPGPTHGCGTVVTPTQTGVLVNGFPATRAGDAIVEAPGGVNMIVVGSQTVFIGSPALPAAEVPVVAAASEPPTIELEAVAKLDALTGEAALDVYGDVDLMKGKGMVELQGGAMAAALKGELPLK